MPKDMNLDVVEAPGALTYVHDDEPGITRRKAGTGWNYKGPDGETIRDEETIDRIRKLAIPPAYTDVWICPDPNGHIQATGRDAKGRKQYRYHPEWTKLHAETKFARMAEFGRVLPRIRRRVEEDLGKRGLSREKALATVIALLERTLIRVGNDEYAKRNKSFGLTTLRNRHAEVKGETVSFSFKGKSGVQHATSVRDRRLARVIRTLQEVKGQRLFQYVDEDGERRAITSSDVNEYLKEIAGEDFSAKDFRTWAGTISAAKALALQPRPTTKAELKKLTNVCVKATAGLLGNTPTVCRSSYIHPAVLQAYAENALPSSFAKAEGRKFELAVIRFLDELSTEVEEKTGMTKDEQVAESNA